MCTHTHIRMQNLHTLVFCVFVPLAHMVDVCICDPPTPAPHPHYTLPPCHPPTSSSQLASPNLSLPVNTPSRLRRPSWPTFQSQRVWGHQSSTHRWLTYLSGSRSTSWVDRIVCVFKHDTRIHMYIHTHIYTSNAHAHTYTCIHVCSGTFIEGTLK